MPRHAVIDIGTNSVKLLVADVEGHNVHPVQESAEQTRLGRGFYDTHLLQPEAIAATGKAVGGFASLAHELGAVSIRVFATSAARDAKNSESLKRAVQVASGLNMEIISGEQEAEWAFRGASTDPNLSTQPILLLDVGGGSTEFILGHGEHKHFRQSFPIGSVRLMEALPHSDPPKPKELSDCRQWLGEFLRVRVAPHLELAIARERCVGELLLVGTGGTASILAGMEHQLNKFDRNKIDGVSLSLECVRHWVSHLWSLPLAKRREVPGLPPLRADVILTGAPIYEAVMACLRFTNLRVTTRGLRFAAVME